MQDDKEKCLKNKKLEKTQDIIQKMEKKFSIDLSKETGAEELEELVANKMFRIKSINFD